MRYQVFKLIDVERSMIKSPFLITNVDMLQWNSDKDEMEMEVIELSLDGRVTSSFFNEGEFLYGMAQGHHYWGETEGLLKAITFCEKELDHESIPGTRIRQRQN